MFYINNFFKILINQGFKGIGFFLITTLFFVLTFAPTSFRDKILGKAQPLENNIAFYVLTDAELSASFITGKLTKLASIQSVRFFTPQELSLRVKKVTDELGIEADLFPSNQLGFKLFLKQNTSQDKINLIQQYIKRMSPTSEFIFSTIEKPTIKSGYLAKYSSLIALAGLSLSWILLAFLIMKPIRKRSYIMERFQRKNWVATKIVASGMFLFLALNILGFVYLKDSFYPSLVTSSGLFLCLTLVMMKTNKWEV